MKRADELDGLSGLIIPGGESTCLARLLVITGLDRAITERHRAGLRLWGTCAGAILLAERVVDETPHLGLIDIEVERNAFGSQLASFNLTTDVPAVDPDPIPLTFIRAPKIRSLGTGVSPLLQIDDWYAAAEDDRTLVTVFHPELTESLAFHRYFAERCGIDVAATGGDWQAEDWTRYAPIPR